MPGVERRRPRPAGCRCCPATARAAWRSRTCRRTLQATAHYRTASPDYFRVDGHPAAARPTRSRRRPRRTAAGRDHQRSAAQRYWPNRNPIGQHFSIDVPGPDHRSSASSATCAPRRSTRRRSRRSTCRTVRTRGRRWCSSLRTPARARRALTNGHARRDLAGRQGSAGRRGADDGRAVVELADAAALQRHAAVGVRRRRGARWRRSACTACWRSSSRSGVARSACAWRSARPAARRDRRRPGSGPAAGGARRVVGLALALAVTRLMCGAAVRHEPDRCRHVRRGRDAARRDRRGASLVPALRASRVDPLIALRDE